jgi:hypothetical protein
MIDYRARLILLSPWLFRYRSLEKGLKTGPGAVLIVCPSISATGVYLKQLQLKDWLRTNSGINKKYFEGKAYNELRSKVKNSFRYGRSEIKEMVRTCFSFLLSCRLTIHLIDSSFRRKETSRHRSSP